MTRELPPRPRLMIVLLIAFGLVGAAVAASIEIDARSPLLSSSRSPAQ